MARRFRQISVQHENSRSRTPPLEVPLRKILRLLNVGEYRWNILLVGDREMKKLHRQYLQDPATTDVLTFDMREDPESSAMHLETVLCTDEARRRASELGHSVEHELLLYAVHSLLHVQGHDDATPSQAARMHQREDELLAQIGVGPVYHWQLNGTLGAANRKPKASKQKPRRLA